MENASKALIIAGAILISILVVSLAVLIFTRFAGNAKEMANMNEQEISAFNSKLTSYLGTQSGSQVNALLQYCLSVNISAKSSGDDYKEIVVTYKDSSGNNATINLDSTSYTKVETGANKHYTVEGTYDDNGLLTIININ